MRIPYAIAVGVVLSGASVRAADEQAWLNYIILGCKLLRRRNWSVRANPVGSRLAFPSPSPDRQWWPVRGSEAPTLKIQVETLPNSCLG